MSSRPLVNAHPEKILAYDVYQQCFVHHFKSWVEDNFNNAEIKVPIGRFNRHVEIASHVTRPYYQDPKNAVSNDIIDKRGRVTIPLIYFGRFEILYVIGIA
ncbi:hypothetical protein IFR05_005860 [Cadophora sp. M221]|nr:hypothetical protein IFR05_005860 [Cadophora sp. M221]